jgi:hypothetical protein
MVCITDDNMIYECHRGGVAITKKQQATPCALIPLARVGYTNLAQFFENQYISRVGTSKGAAPCARFDPDITLFSKIFFEKVAAPYTRARMGIALH